MPWLNLAGAELSPSLTHTLLLYSSQIDKLLQDAGFCDITPTPGHMQHATQFLATRDGRNACICFPPPCSFILDVPHLSQEQCNACDADYPEHDVYYACLFCSGSDEEKELELLGPMIVKQQGNWLRDELLHSQYLPISMRDGMDRYSSIFNGAVLFKLYQVLFPAIFAKQDAPVFNVKNLFSDEAQGESGYLAFRLFSTPTLVSIVGISQEDKSLTYLRSLFLHCGGTTSELELLDMPQEADPADGQVKLLAEGGHTLLAECPEAVLYRKRMLTGCRYLWFLSMVADHIGPMKKEFKITSGPMYEIHCQEYRDEHGCEPPDDYALCISTSEMRSFMQNDEDTYATVIGQVVRVEDALVDCQPMKLITMRPIVDNDNVQLQVFASPEVLGNFTPEEGDTITVAGYVYASADELLADVPSWQDSPALGEILQEQDNSHNAHIEYEHLSRYSMGHAVAAAAFAGAGWQVQETNPNRIFSRNAPLHAIAQDGSAVIICVDTVVNGQINSFPYSEIDNLPDTIKNTFGEDYACCHCTVHLDYNVAAERYAISMETTPDFPGVKNTLIFAACPFQESILSLETGKAPTKKQLRPPVLDDRMLSGLFRDAMAHGNWAAFSEWIREEADYTSESTRDTYHFGKVSILRYLSERVEMWCRNPHTQWKDFSFSTGSVLHNGTRRPCAAMHYLGIPSAITIFEDNHGLVSHIRNLPWSTFCTYIQEEPAIHQSIQAGVIPAVEESVVRPPHDQNQPATAITSRHPALQAAASRALLLLEKENCTPVHFDLSSGAIPHLWFRDAQERLCWAVLYTADMRECEFKDTLTLGHAITLKKLRHYPCFIIPCIHTNDGHRDEISMFPIDWERWKNL